MNLLSARGLMQPRYHVPFLSLKLGSAPQPSMSVSEQRSPCIISVAMGADILTGANRPLKKQGHCGMADQGRVLTVL